MAQNLTASSRIHCLIFSLLLASATAAAAAAAADCWELDCPLGFLVITGTLQEEGDAAATAEEGGGGGRSGVEVLCDEERPQRDGCSEARKDDLGVAPLDLLSLAENETPKGGTVYTPKLQIHD